MTPVTTRSYHNSRSCANSKETVLNVSNVTQRGIKKLFSLPIPGDKRGCEAQPLIAPNVRIADGSSHDLVILATMVNTVLAYDAHDGTLIWQIGLGNPIKGTKAIDLYLVNDHWGILSTPVIDKDSNILYCVSWTSPDGEFNKGVHSLHAISLRDGTEVVPRISLEGATYNPGNGLPVQKFLSKERKQRSGLLLTSVHGVKTVFIASGTISENDSQARGWIIAVDVNSFEIAATFTSSSRFHGGGIWQAAQGLASDSKGFIYCMTGNGAFDGKTEFGESFIKLKYTPPNAGHSGKLEAVDWWSPFSDTGRVGLDPTLIALPKLDTGRASNANDFDDMDLGSGGPVLIEDFDIIAGSGKDGILYVMDSNKMGKTTNTDFADPSKNYSKLKSTPIWFTFFPGFGVNAAPQDITTLNVNFFNRTHHQHSTPVVYDSPVHGKMLFNWGENECLRAWTISNDGIVTFLALGNEFASPKASDENKGGMPGGIISLSSNGKVPGSALIWALVPEGDANRHLTPGILYCYDANDFATDADGTKRLKVLWKSSDWGLTFTHPKFNAPVVSGGNVFVPTYDARIDVYGLA
jgi:outer membrane protein assembly factor BamB